MKKMLVALTTVLALAILSSWYYYSWNRKEGAGGQFWLMQVVTIASGCTAFYIGSVFGIVRFQRTRRQAEAGATWPTRRNPRRKGPRPGG